MRTAISDGYTCPNCGAPVTTEICEFCGASTAVASKNADMKYPAIDCDEVDDDGKSENQMLFMGVGIPCILHRNTNIFHQDNRRSRS